jgi:hypothetical protein
MLSTRILSILAIAAALCFVALIALQVWEHVYYGQPPSVWPAP